MTRPEFSVIVPVYNSSAVLNQLITETSQAFISANASFEIILVNDHSTDNSFQVMEETKANRPVPPVLIDLKKNVGQYGATIIGLSQAKGDMLITMDADFCPRRLNLETLIVNKLPGD